MVPVTSVAVHIEFTDRKSNTKTHLNTRHILQILNKKMAAPDSQ